MTQQTPTIGAGQSGVDYRAQDNDGKKALLNHHKGGSAPSYAEAGIIWLDDAATPWVLKVYDGADWIKLGDINATTNAFFTYNGTAPPRLLNDAADTGAANAYAVAPVPAIAAYATGQVVLLRPANGNTGAATLAVSGLAAKNIKLMDGNNPFSGALLTTGIYQLVYDGTNFVLLNPSPAGSGSLVLIASATASNSASVDFTSGINSAYDEYIVTFANVLPATDNVDLWLRTSTNGGSSFDSAAGSYQYVSQGLVAPTTVSNIGSSGDTKCVLSSGVGNAAGAGVSGRLTLYQPSAATQVRFTALASAVTAANLLRLDTSSGHRHTAADVDALRFLFSSGNIASGAFHLYGVKKA
jgi:hypothetical protein